MPTPVPHSFQGLKTILFWNDPYLNNYFLYHDLPTGRDPFLRFECPESRCSVHERSKRGTGHPSEFDAVLFHHLDTSKSPADLPRYAEKRLVCSGKKVTYCETHTHNYCSRYFFELPRH